MVRKLIREYRRFGDFRSFVEKSSWDEIILQSEGALDNFCLGVVVFAFSYFGTHMVMIIFR
jgi:hypothetical protein